MIKYWKKYNNLKYGFENAVNIVVEGQNLAMQVEKNYGNHKKIVLTKEQLENDSEKDLELPVWAALSSNWEVVEEDYEKEQKLVQLRDKVRDKLNLDSRFYDIDKEDISEIWDHVSDQLINDDLALELVDWMIETGKI